MILAFWSSHFAQELTNFMGGPVQTAEGIGGLGILTLGYRHLQCHQNGCHRLGRFPLGHLRLCHKHHPRVPNHGHIGADEIKAASEHDELSGRKS